MKRLLFFLLVFSCCGCSDEDTIAKPDGPNIKPWPPEGNPSVLPPLPPAVIDIAEGEYDGYWYPDGKRKRLEAIPDKFFVIFKEADAENIYRQLSENGFSVRPGTITRYSTSNYLYDGYPEELFDCLCMEVEGSERIDAVEGLVYSNHLYYMPESSAPDMAVGSSNFLYLHIRSEEDIETVERHLRDLHAYAVGRKSLLFENFRSVVCISGSAGNHVQVANWLRNTGLFAFAYPEMNDIIWCH